MSGSGSKGEQSNTTRVDIPEFLRPFLTQGANVAGGALGNLQNLAGSNLVAGFAPEQEQAFQLASDVAGGAGGFIPTAQQQLLQTAQGRDISSFLPESAFSALSDTAGGNFLFGGEGFDAAVNAAVQAATPQIASAFGGTAGGLSGGLARQAVGDTAVNAFASQFANERRNQIGTAGLLSNLGNAERGRQEFAVGRLPDAGLLSSNILSQIGGQRQQLEQDRLRSPFESQLQLLQAALGRLPIQSLLGQTSNSAFSGFELGFSGFPGGDPAGNPSFGRDSLNFF